MREKPPSVSAAIALTAAALLDFWAVLSMVSEGHPRTLLVGALELFLIAAAIWSWVVYLKAYTDYKIELSIRGRTESGPVGDARPSD